MSETNYTPGPWRAFKAMSSICVGSNETVERVEDLASQMHIKVFGDNRIANARLIAAAPELLVACKLLLTEIQVWEHEQGTHPFAQAARDAIDKAAGGTT